MMKKLGDLRVFVSSQGVEATNAKLGLTEKKATMASKAAMMLKTALLGIGAYAVIRALKSVITQFTDYTVSIDKFTKQTGMATDTIQKLVYAAEQEHGSLEALNKGLMNLTVRLGYAGDGLETYLRYFRALGIEYKKADGTLRNTEDVFLDIADVVEKGTLSTKELAAVMQLFGARSGKELIPLLKKGRYWFEEMGNEAEQLGIVLEEKTIKQGKEFSDQMTKMKGVMRGLTYAIAKDLLPAFADLFDFATELIKSFTDWKWLIPDITQAITGQVPEVNRLTTAYSKLDDELQDIIEREGKYSIEVMAKLLELDEKLRQAELKRIGGLQTLGEARDSSNLKLEDALFLTPGLLAAAQDLMTYGYIPEKKILAEMKDARKEENDEKEKSIEITEDLTEAMIEHWKAWGSPLERLEEYKEKTEEMLPVMQEFLEIMLAITYNLPHKIEQTEKETETIDSGTEAVNAFCAGFNSLSFGISKNAEIMRKWAEITEESLGAVIIKLLALAAIVKFLEALGVPAGALLSAGQKIGLFQTPTGDAFAYREGRDMGKFFFEGFGERLKQMGQNININQEPVNIVIHTGDPSTFVEFVSGMPNPHKSKFYREVTEKARLLES